MSLTDLDLSSFDIKNVKNFRAMFNQCYNLKYLNLSSFVLNNNMSIENIFCACNSLKKVKINKKSFNKLKAESDRCFLNIEFEVI